MAEVVRDAEKDIDVVIGNVGEVLAVELAEELGGGLLGFLNAETPQVQGSVNCVFLDAQVGRGYTTRMKEQ